MKMMGSFFAAELKSRLRPRDIVIYLAFILVLILMARDGRQNYLNTQNNTKPFQETEKTKVDNYILYSQYGGFGLRVMFIPSPYSVLFTNPAFEGLLSNVNTAERLSIYKSLKGRNFFSEHSGQINYLVILLVFSVFFGPIYGYYTVKSKLFLKFLSSVSSRRKVYIAAVGARL
ncbi:MAG: hypothetical protein GY950_01610, partial [bacterium]|nr:hypothetical protein [bacterium]